MLKTKKYLAILLTMAMIVSVFTGCGKTTNTDTQDNGVTPTQAAAETANQESEVKPELKALVTYNSSMDYNDYPVQKYLEETTGYKVLYDTLPQDNATDKLNAIMASGQEYDFVIIWDRGAYSNYATQGALTDLEPLINEYGPNISSSLASEMMDAMRVDGKLFAIPNAAASGNADYTNVNTGFMVRQDWLDKLQLKAPTTLDEFTNMLQQFKDKDPNGNGDKNIALTVDSSLQLWDYGMGGAFGIATQWTDVNGELVPRVMMPGFKDYILYLKDLYKKGLLDNETPANQASTAQEKFTSGRAGAFSMSHWANVPTVADTMKNTQPDAKYTYLAPLSGPYGAGAIAAGDLKYAVDNFVFIPKSSEHATDVIKYFNEKLESETFKGMVIGEENVHYTVKDGGFYPILPQFFEERGNANLFMTGTNKEYSKYWQARLKKDDRMYEGWKQLNEDFAANVVIEPISKAPSLPTNAKYSGALKQLTSDFVVKSVVDDFSDDTLNDFIARWKVQGGDEVIKEINGWYATVK